MIFKYRNIGITAIVAGASLTIMLAQTRAKSVASGHREILPQTTKSWKGKPCVDEDVAVPHLPIATL
jgi:hypothetical protein